MKAYYLFPIFILLSLSFTLGSCSRKAIFNPAIGLNGKPVDQTNAFPTSWVGVYSGDLEIFKEDEATTSVNMTLEIAAIEDSKDYSWTIIYGKGSKESIREYTLKQGENGFYIDEGNSIKLPLSVFDGQVVSRFSVEGNLLLTSYELFPDAILFEVLSGKNQSNSVSGGTIYEGEAIPMVSSYPISVSQRAFLSRIQ